MSQLSFKINYNGDLRKITSAPDLLLDDIAQRFGFDDTQVVTFKVQEEEIDISDVIARAHAMTSGKALAVSIDVTDLYEEPVQSCDDTEPVTLKQKAAKSKARALATQEEAHKMMLTAKQHARIAKDADKAARVAEKEEAKAVRIAQKEASKAEAKRVKEHTKMKVETNAFQPQSSAFQPQSNAFQPQSNTTADLNEALNREGREWSHAGGWNTGNIWNPEGQNNSWKGGRQWGLQSQGVKEQLGEAADWNKEQWKQWKQGAKQAWKQNAKQAWKQNASECKHQWKAASHAKKHSAREAGGEAQNCAAQKCTNDQARDAGTRGKLVNWTGGFPATVSSTGELTVLPCGRVCFSADLHRGNLRISNQQEVQKCGGKGTAAQFAILPLDGKPTVFRMHSHAHKDDDCFLGVMPGNDDPAVVAPTPSCFAVVGRDSEASMWSFYPEGSQEAMELRSADPMATAAQVYGRLHVIVQEIAEQTGIPISMDQVYDEDEAAEMLNALIEFLPHGIKRIAMKKIGLRVFEVAEQKVPREWEPLLQDLTDMGFENRDNNIAALRGSEGDVKKAVKSLVQALPQKVDREKMLTAQ